MDARLVWNTWRRLLASDDLADWAVRGEGRDPPAGLSAAERIILDDYAATPEATDTNIGMFRRGLTRNARGALSLAPVTRRLLLATGLDFERIAEEFVRLAGYRDHGPNMWGLAEDFIAFLSSRPELSSAPHQDALAVDRATAALARRLGDAGEKTWPEDAARRFVESRQRVELEDKRFFAHSAAALVSSTYDLTPWLENPDLFDPEAKLECAPRNWLIYFPAADADVEYASLSDRSARAFSALGAGMSLPELAGSLPGVLPDEVRDAVAALCELGVVTIEGGPAPVRRGRGTAL